MEDNIIGRIIEEPRGFVRLCRPAAGGRRLQPRELRHHAGIALTPVKFGISFTKTEYNQAGALVHVYTDGSIQLNHGGTEMGQGLYTKVRRS